MCFELDDLLQTYYNTERNQYTNTGSTHVHVPIHIVIILKLINICTKKKNKKKQGKQL